MQPFFGTDPTDILSVQYNSYATHYKEAECLRQQTEPFLYNFGVDIVFHGKHLAYYCARGSCAIKSLLQSTS